MDLVVGLFYTAGLFIGIIFLVKFLCEAIEWLHNNTKWQK